MKMQQNTQTNSSEALQDNDYAFLAQLVEECTGIILRGERHRNMVQGRLIRRLRTLQITSFSEYCKLLQGPDRESEVSHVINAVTTNVTSFFRESHHFDHLKEYLGKIAAERSEPRVRIWSSACSSGEEPYSIAMTMISGLPNIRQWDAKILATDIDTNIIEKAKKGHYPRSAEEVLPSGYASKYTVTAPGDMMAIVDPVKALVHFKNLNLLEQWPIKGPFDAIFCRNVFIYFNAETQFSIATRFIDLLRPGGFLYIGHSENLLNLSDRMENVGKTIYRKIK